MRGKKDLPVITWTRERPPADQLDQFLETALRGLLEIMEVDTGWLQLLAPGGDRPLASACQGCTAVMKQEAEALALRQAGRPDGAVFVADLTPSGDHELQSFAEAGFGSLVMVPLRTNLLQGFLGVVSREASAFDGDAAEVLMLKARLIGAALEKGALGRGLAEILAGQAQPGYVKELRRIAAIAGGQYRRVRRAMGKADEKLTRATLDFLREPGWEGLLEKYQEEAGNATPDASGADPAGENDIPSEKQETVPRRRAGANSSDDFASHAGRMEAFRRSHADLK